MNILNKNLFLCFGNRIVKQRKLIIQSRLERLYFKFKKKIYLSFFLGKQKNFVVSFFSTLFKNLKVSSLNKNIDYNFLQKTKDLKSFFLFNNSGLLFFIELYKIKQKKKFNFFFEYENNVHRQSDFFSLYRINRRFITFAIKF